MQTHFFIFKNLHIFTSDVLHFNISVDKQEMLRNADMLRPCYACVALQLFLNNLINMTVIDTFMRTHFDMIKSLHLYTLAITHA